MSGELSNDMITKWGKAGQLFKQPGLLVCLRHQWGALSLSIQKLWYLHSSSVINILYDPSLANVSPANLSPPATLFKHFFLFPCDCLNLFQVNPREYNVTCLLLFPYCSLFLLPVRKIWESFVCTTFITTRGAEASVYDSNVQKHGQKGSDIAWEAWLGYFKAMLSPALCTVFVLLP